MRQLPDLHAILDVAEVMLTEHMDAKQRAEFNSNMYRPELNSKAAPAGFDRESQMAAFAAFAAMAED